MKRNLSRGYHCYPLKWTEHLKKQSQHWEKGGSFET